MDKLVMIDGKETRLVANGATPRLYRSLFRKDIFSDMTHALNSDGEVENSEVFENLAFVMARQGGLAEDIDTWLGAMSSPMAVINAVPQILELWLGTNETIADGKKK